MLCKYVWFELLGIGLETGLKTGLETGFCVVLVDDVGPGCKEG